MKAAERRDAIIKKLKNSAEPLSGAALAQELGVSRQVIVQDISILRAQGNEVLSTNRGYVLQHSETAADESGMSSYITRCTVPCGGN